jgi:hypothetical protein
MSEAEKEQQLLDMNLHQTIKISDFIIVIRVIGGWIYEIDTGQYEATENQIHYFKNHVFVPENKI